MRNSVALALGALVAFPVAAAAQDAVQRTGVECLCVLPAEAGSGVAVVQDIRGQVLLSDSVGYTPIQSSAELSVGDRVILLSDGQAVLAAGPTCQVTLAADSIVNLLPTEAGICVAHASTAQENATVIQPAADLPAPVREAPQFADDAPQFADDAPQFADDAPPPVTDVVLALVGAAAFAGGMAAIILLADDPVSPE